MRSVFSATNYRDVVANGLQVQSEARGGRSRLATSLGCHRSHLTHVLDGTVHLTMEQGERLCRHWHFTSEETNYFLVLLSKDRAGTQELKRIFEKNLKALCAAASKKQAVISPSIFDEEQLGIKHFSKWWYSALLLACSSWKDTLRASLVRRLRISEADAKEALATMVGQGLIKQKGPSYVSNNRSISIDSQSELHKVNAMAWRNWLTSKSCLLNVPPETQYTGLYSLSEKQAEKVRELIFEFVEKVREDVVPRPEEEIFLLVLDFWRVAEKS